MMTCYLFRNTNIYTSKKYYALSILYSLNMLELAIEKYDVFTHFSTAANDVDSFTIKNSGIILGASLSVSGGNLTSDDLEIILSDSISQKILARITSMGD